MSTPNSMLLEDEHIQDIRKWSGIYEDEQENVRRLLHEGNSAQEGQRC